MRAKLRILAKKLADISRQNASEVWGGYPDDVAVIWNRIVIATNVDHNASGEPLLKILMVKQAEKEVKDYERSDAEEADEWRATDYSGAIPVNMR